MTEDSKFFKLGEALEGAGSEESTLIMDLAARFSVSEEDAEHCLEAVRVLRQALGDDAPALVAAAPELPEDYEILGELGRGGMGIVYRARQKSLDRPVAVKVLRPGEALFRDALRRFEREARSLARLRHPHIVGIHEVGRAGNNLFYSMDLIEGSSLAEILEKGPLTPSQAARWLRQVASAVAATHAHGLIHRDLKPGNILIDKGGDALVVDFGLARSLEAPTDLTGTGAILGTPAYMSPEQAAGDHDKVGEATDIYALGTILYECVTGVRPFKGRLAETLEAVIRSEPTAPRKVRPSISLELELVIQAAMAKEPGDRYPSARALEEDLGRFEKGEPIRAKRPPLWTRFKRRLRRHRRSVAQVVVMAALIALLAVAGSRLAPPASPRVLADKGRALLDRDEPRAAMYLAEEALEKHGFRGPLFAKPERFRALDPTKILDPLAGEFVALYSRAAVAAAREERHAGRAAEADAIIVAAWDRVEDHYRFGYEDHGRALAWRRLAIAEPRISSGDRLVVPVLEAFLGHWDGVPQEERQARMVTALRSVAPALRAGDPERELALDFLAWFFLRSFPKEILPSFPLIKPEGFTELLLELITHFERGLRGQWTTNSGPWMWFLQFAEKSARSGPDKERLEARARELAGDPRQGTLTRLLAGELLCRLADLPIWIVKPFNDNKGLWDDFRRPQGPAQDYSKKLALVERAVALYDARDRSSPWPCFEPSFEELRGRSKLGTLEKQWIRWHMDRGSLKTETPTADEAIASLRTALGLEGASAASIFKRLMAVNDGTQLMRLHHLLRAVSSKPAMGDPPMMNPVNIWPAHFKLDRPDRAPVKRRLRLAVVIVDRDGAPRLRLSHSRELIESQPVTIELREEWEQLRTRERPELSLVAPGWSQPLSPLWEKPWQARRGRRTYRLSLTARLDWVGRDGARYQGAHGPVRLRLTEIEEQGQQRLGLIGAAHRVLNLDVSASSGLLDRRALPFAQLLIFADGDLSEAPWTLDDWRAAIASSFEKLADSFKAARIEGSRDGGLRGPRYKLASLALLLPDERIAAASERLTALDPKAFPRLPIAHQLTATGLPFDFKDVPRVGWEHASLLGLIALRAPDPEIRKRALARIAETQEFRRNSFSVIRPLRLAQDRGVFTLPQAMAAPAAAERAWAARKERERKLGIVAWITASASLHLLIAALLWLSTRERAAAWLRSALLLSGCALALALSLLRFDLNDLVLNPPILVFALLTLGAYHHRHRSQIALALFASAFFLGISEALGLAPLPGLGQALALLAFTTLLFRILKPRVRPALLEASNTAEGPL